MNDSNITACQKQELASGGRLLENIVLAVISLGVMPALSVIGLFLNLITLFILKEQKKKTSTLYIVAGLTVADMMSIGTSMATYPPIYLKPDYLSDEELLRYIVPILTYPLNVSRVSTLLCAIERLFAVCLPNTYKTIWTRKFGKAVVFLCYVANAFLTLLKILLLKLEYIFVIEILLILLLFVVNVVCNIAILLKLKSHSRNIIQFASTSIMYREQRLTQTMLRISAFYIVCSCFFIAFNVFIFASNLCPSSPVVLLLTFLAGTADIIYSSFNTLIFVFSNNKYRTVFVIIMSKTFIFCKRTNTVRPEQSDGNGRM